LPILRSGVRAAGFFFVHQTSLDKERFMKPGQLISAVKKRYWIIILATIICALVAAVIGHVQKPVYKVDILMAAVAPRNPTTRTADATTQIAYTQTMPTVANAAESIDIARAVSARLKKSGIDIPPEQLLKKATAGPIANTTSIRITFTDGNPQRVSEIANAWGGVTATTLSNDPIMLGGTLQLTNEAVPPEKPTQPKPTIYVGLGIFVGLILGFALVVGIEYFDPHFRSAEEVEEVLGLPVLGMLPKKMKGNAAREAYSNLRTSLLFSLAERNTASVVVTGAVPVKGMHDVTVNLAKSISDTGRKTLLVDCDMRDRAVSGLMAAGDLPGISEVLEGETSLDGRIARTTFPNLYLLPAGKQPSSPSDIISRPRFKSIIEQLEGEFDEVVLDAPSLTRAVDGAIVAASVGTSIVVVDVESCTRNSALLALASFNRMQLRPSGVVLTNVKSRRIGRKVK